MVPEIVVERSAIHRQWWVERTSMIVVSSGCDLGLGRGRTRTIVDADLLPAGPEVEVDVMNINWSVQEAIETFAPEFAVLRIYQFWNEVRRMEL